uniref:Myosin tail domain-containing protein n=1 Tax=Oncorhynchus mykiss TaxID=8022 RepID=A0A8C7TY13_ONCMY
MGPQVLKRFYSCTIESILTGCITAWYGNCSSSDRKTLQRVVCTAQYITGARLPAIQDLYIRRCQRKALKIVKWPFTSSKYGNGMQMACQHRALCMFVFTLCSSSLSLENSEDSAKVREVSKRLYAQLKESEKRHKEERDRMQFSRRLDEQSKHLQWVEGEAGERGQKVEELQRLLGGMELEGAVLRGKIATSEAELLQLRAAKEGVTEELEKELAVLKEKIHHLDDMLKSQQRKVRHMIEQLQNSRTVIQERERVIRDLEEKVAFLEAEVKMRAKEVVIEIKS